jgi:hypothetical protein
MDNVQKVNNCIIYHCNELLDLVEIEDSLNYYQLRKQRMKSTGFTEQNQVSIWQMKPNTRLYEESEQVWTM